MQGPMASQQLSSPLPQVGQPHTAPAPCARSRDAAFDKPCSCQSPVSIRNCDTPRFVSHSHLQTCKFRQGTSPSDHGTKAWTAPRYLSASSQLTSLFPLFPRLSSYSFAPGIGSGSQPVAALFQAFLPLLQLTMHVKTPVHAQSFSSQPDYSAITFSVCTSMSSWYAPFCP